MLTLVVDGERCPADDGAPLGRLECVYMELSDIAQRLRFEHPDIGAVVVTGADGEAFRVGLGTPIEAEPDPAARDAVGRFAEEVRWAIEDAAANSGQRWLTALNGSASGPAYELALATEEIVLVDDGRSAVTLPGVRGEEAQRRGLVDLVVPPDRFSAVVYDRALTTAATSSRAGAGAGVELSPLLREEFDDGFAYPDLRVELDGEGAAASLTLVAPHRLECFAPDPGPARLRSRWWPLAVCRQLDDAIVLLRRNWPEIGTIVLRTEGDPLAVAAADVAMMTGYDDDWFVREVVLHWRRTLDRVEHLGCSLVALIVPGSCFVGTLLELAFVADRAYMFDGADADRPELRPAEIFLTGMNLGPLARRNGSTRLQTRLAGRQDRHDAVAGRVGDPLAAAEAAELGLVSAAIDLSDWGGEMRRVVEERDRLPRHPG